MSMLFAILCIIYLFFPSRIRHTRCALVTGVQTFALPILMGPLIRESQRAKVEHFIGLGRDEGARLVHGGGRPQDLPKGFFTELTLFDDVENSMTIAQEEIFGPVGAVIGFDTDEEALRIAKIGRAHV